MRPIIIRIGIIEDILQIAVDGSCSDSEDKFKKIKLINGKSWAVMECKLGDEKRHEDLRYIKQRFVESYEHNTDNQASILNEDGNDDGKVSFDALPDDEEGSAFELDVFDEVIHEDRSKVRWEDARHSIREIYLKFKEGDIIPQPSFQRGFIWKPSTKKRFIESILMRLPIPVVYMSETVDDKLEVIDGQQRLTTIVQFIDGKFSLSGLKVLDDLNGMLYSDLNPKYKKLFNDYQVTSRVLESSCPPDLKFDMFERLNTGSAQLNKQELRNCICRGRFNELLKELSKSDKFLASMGWVKPNERMKGEEWILRFFAFYYLNIESIKNYEKTLTDYMRGKSNIEPDEISKHKVDFTRALDNCVTVFGDQPFRMWKRALSDNDCNGLWESQNSSTLFEILMTGLAHYQKPVVVANSNSIKEELIYHVTTDQKLYDSLKFGTNSPDRMAYRNITWRAALRDLLGSNTKNPRVYSTAFKEQLFRADSTCCICNQRIMTIDDAAVDHIIHYWRGGQTIPSNARLTHRYCNNKRGGR
jgi:hypothetical protein